MVTLRMVTRPSLSVIAAAAFTITIATAQTAAAQSATAPNANGHVPAEAERNSRIFELRPERHGISHFPRIKHPQVEYEATNVLTFDKYHTVDVMYTWLRRWAEQHPNIVELYEIGRSYEGRPILQMTLTNKSTGRKEDKPAAYFEGGRHSGEISSSESVLWLANHLLQNYGKDPRITRLLDTKAITLRPQNNPDGSNLYLHTAIANRSSVRPIDNDNDGLLDEDDGDDIDGDGVLYTMRWKPSMTGRDTVAPNMVLDERDPSGRLMRAARAGEKGIWRTMSEGIDNDGDGRYNEDGIGGLDLHRNYLENWRPDNRGDRTGRGYTQNGAGAFPLSEPETRSVVLWLLANPNIAVVNSMDTRVPMHLRPPSTSKSEERMYMEDLRYYKHFDTVGVRITGYPWAGDVYHTYATRDREDAVPQPLFGHGPDFGYFYYGAIWYGDELWNGGIFRDENNDGRRDQLDALIWDDRDNYGRGYKPWTKATHPDFGVVEIGGSHPKFFSQNGPPHMIEQVAGNQARFNLELAFALPELEITNTSARRLDAKGDSATYEVTVSWKNNGKLPTALKQAQLVKIVQEDRVILDLGRQSGNARARLVQPTGRGGVFFAGWTEPGETKTAKFRVRVHNAPGVKATVRLESTRGGVVTREVAIGSI